MGRPSRAGGQSSPGASYRTDALQDDAFAPGRRLALVREPDNEHDPNAVAVWDAERRLQAGYVPAEVAPELRGDEQALALWEFRGEDGQRIGLRVLLAPADAWIQEPARVRGWFSREYEPVETIEPGGSVSFHVPNAGWSSDVDVEPERPEGAGHALYGPVEVGGARAGQTLAVRIDEVEPRDWGRDVGGRGDVHVVAGRWLVAARRAPGSARRRSSA